MQPPQAYDSERGRRVEASGTWNAAAPAQGLPDVAFYAAPLPSTSTTTQAQAAHPPLWQRPFRPFHAPTLDTLQPSGLSLGASHPDLFQSINLTAVGPISSSPPPPVDHTKAPSLPSPTHRSTDSECFHSAIAGAPTGHLLGPKPDIDSSCAHTSSAHSSPGHS
ncbi:hypothetical protein H4R35_007571, partial [Dimargaris xerosporica]